MSLLDSAKTDTLPKLLQRNAEESPQASRSPGQEEMYRVRMRYSWRAV